MTDEMLALARENQRKAGATNVEFLKGTIEAIPLPDQSVDVIISNCVINLSSRQGCRPARSVSRAQAWRAFRGIRRGDPRRSALRDSTQHGTLGRMRRRSATRRRVRGKTEGCRIWTQWSSSLGACIRSKTPEPFWLSPGSTLTDSPHRLMARWRARSFAPADRRRSRAVALRAARSNEIARQR